MPRSVSTRPSLRPVRFCSLSACSSCSGEMALCSSSISPSFTRFFGRSTISWTYRHRTVDLLVELLGIIDAALDQEIPFRLVFTDHDRLEQNHQFGLFVGGLLALEQIAEHRDRAQERRLIVGRRVLGRHEAADHDDLPAVGAHYTVGFANL